MASESKNVSSTMLHKDSRLNSVCHTVIRRQLLLLLQPASLDLLLLDNVDFMRLQLKKPTASVTCLNKIEKKKNHIHTHTVAYTQRHTTKDSINTVWRYCSSRKMGRLTGTRSEQSFSCSPTQLPFPSFLL